MSDKLSGENILLIQGELQKILRSSQFSNAPIVRAFLEYAVNETVSGRGSRIKAYTIASEVFDKGPEFDPSSDTIVRTTAGRVRKALDAYNLACDEERRVVITLPKGCYVPDFTFHDMSAPPEPETIGRPPQRRFSFSRTGILIGACISVVVAMAVLAIFWWRNERDASAGDLIIAVRPVQYGDRKQQSLARAVDVRLAPALSRIGLAEIYPPDAPIGTKEDARKASIPEITLTLKADIADSPTPELRWQLMDGASGRLLWAAREALSSADPASIDKVIDKVSFQILGESGAVPLALARYHSEIFSKQTCLSRTQLLQTMEDAGIYPKMRECLEQAVARFPNDPSAWAILSTFYTVRTRYYAAGNPKDRAALIELARRAAAKAEDLAPDAYLTKVALMQLALRQGNVAEFDALQTQLRANYPGDISLKLRIASRLARLGRGREALAIYDEARTDWGLDLNSRAGDIALGYFVEGDYETARGEILRTTSDQRYVLIIKAAILGKLGLTKEARPVIAALVASDPDIKHTFYPWLTELNWARPLIVNIANGLAGAGLDVDVDNDRK